ncbi:hypothetical protein B0T22DRAFT_465994 [Podospora appendiculata]|uniref:Uncharacterized protein n=1 Tax=Podospora appendiculata TaxID=314037 RepID=A0AAE1CAI7_9PEZI|nr:hypothetical protein B0T22DRAFT_465994 [Podospora appendiculata]
MASPDQSAPTGNASHKSFTQATDELKAKLDEAATRTKHPHQGKDSEGSSLVDKVSKYVPASVSKMLGKHEASDNPVGQGEETTPPGPPHRPEHDANIGEFLRDTHRSTGISLDEN